MQAPKRRGGRSKRQASSRIPTRLNILMGIVIVMLGLLAIRLANLQITNSAMYKNEVNSAEVSVEQIGVQRGMIFDSTGRKLVSNEGSQAITFTKPKLINEKQMYDLANSVGALIKIDTKRLSQTNMNLYYLNNPDNAKKVKELSGTKRAPGTDQYVKDLTTYVNDHNDIVQLSDDEKNKAMIFQKMMNAYALSTVYLKEEGVTDQEIASIGERQAELPGVRVGLYYKRQGVKDDDLMASILGRVSTSTTGLPEDRINQMLTEGYSRDDSVGTSNLEMRYEDALRGTKREVELSVKDGEPVEKVRFSGQSGDNMTLTINSKFQADVQKILRDNMPGGTTQGAYSVVMNPTTGGIYAMNGITNSDGKSQDDAMATINSSAVVGSVVKPALITQGLLTKTITPENNVFVDTPIDIAGTASKTSWFNKKGENSIPLSGSDALMVSSNSYVMQLMLKMGGLNYSPGMNLGGLDPEIFTTMRQGFNAFGLGVKTGIDLPGETAGVRGEASRERIGNALDESFGQYDTYTTMQLAQYVSTIANGGYRMRPHVVQEIQHRENGRQDRVATTVDPEVLGTINWTAAERAVIWDGMEKVVNGNSKFLTGRPLQKQKPTVYAKTGTAETFTNGASTLTYSIVAFVPGEDVAIAAVIPGVPAEMETIVNQTIANEILDSFWKHVKVNPVKGEDKKKDADK
ncbi:peptidoglycan D,D-transpeptidase FtsI family protein [Weissella tructae]|uniref:Penicillin-binding protein 2B n=2 Tax=Weissella TaxID=46255 RepID=A0A075U1A7_9LACO|nr:MULTISPECIES: penicillin-binding transpeptidase domain-containing protein [Weissella]AIG65938.1 Penicillin-binding protein 2B [Weissella tructae]AIM63316.1 Penicillin-binding protein 2B [Weissella ceti]ELA07309.1 cell division protein FtsI/penicillin-binding protein 2 [Weissella ceti NC36]QVV91093.1 penicillin-binding protein 2 [Weissella tructae]